jgi:Leucine-rich repeat (LRR) protein
LSDLPPGLFDLPGLIGLFIGSNNLERIPANICNLRQLGVLNVHGNRLRWLPGEIVDVIRTAEHEKFRLFVSANPLLQPFSYVGLRDLFDEPKDGFRMPLVPYTVKELAQRMDRLKALAASEGSTQGTRTLQEEQRRWILRLYQHYRAIPEMVWLQGRYIYSHSTEEEEEILGKWSVTQGSGDSVRAVENAFGNMALQSRHALRHQTFLMGATPVCYLDISGRPIEAGTILPSELPMDQIILPARLLAVPKPPVLNNIPGRKIESLDVLRPCTTPPRQTKTHVHSLFSLSLASASTVSELHHLPSLLPDDAPESVQRGLDMAIEARNEGGRTCFACKRSFIVPRAEWVEYHFLANSFEDCRIVEDGFDELFVPFLRTVCSWGCVPHFEFDDE